MLGRAAGGAIGRSVPQAAGSDMKRDQCQSHRCPRISPKRIPVSPCFWDYREFCCFDHTAVGAIGRSVPQGRWKRHEKGPMPIAPLSSYFAQTNSSKSL